MTPHTEAEMTITLNGVSMALMTVLVGVLYSEQERQPPSLMLLLGLGAIVAGGLIAVSAVLLLTRRRRQTRSLDHLGPYTLEEKIGEGGMGAVYRARHALLKRPAAIKLLRPARAGKQNLARFEREVQLTSMLTHPNTISVYDFGRTPEGSFYYAMEYLDGLDLQRLVEDTGPQPPARVAYLLAQLCGALVEAHGVGLIHRDIKPANVFLCARGGMLDVVKVLDFGLIKELGKKESGVQASEVGAIVGTPLYLPPEMLTSPEKIDGRSDLYAVGALGYFLLTGAPPFSGNTVVEVCCHHLHTVPVPPSERVRAPIPPELEKSILSCLSKSPERRPRDAASLRAALLSLASTWTQEKATRWWAQRHAPGQASRLARPAAGSRHCAPIASVEQAA